MNITSLDQLKDLTPAERKKVFDQIIASGVLNEPAQEGDVLEVEITITEEAKT